MTLTRRTVLALALMTGISPAIAQQFPTVPDHSFIGRIGVGGSSGPSQAIPFTYALAAMGGAQSANTVWAGPTSGGVNTPSFRALVGADLPVPGASSLGGVKSLTCSTSNWFNTLSTAGALGCSQPNFTDLAGSISAAQIPAGTIVNAAISNSAAIALSKLAAQANNTVVGNISGTAAPVALTQAQLTALINLATTGLPGLVGTLPNDGTKFWNGLGAYAAPTSAGTHILLATLTASTSASLNDSVACGGTNCLTATYSAYELIFSGVIPATNGAAAQLQVHSGGAYKSTGYLNSCIEMLSSSTPAACTANTTNISTSFNSTATDATSNPKNSSPGLSGVVTLFNPSASQITNINYHMSYLNAAGTGYFTIVGSGAWNTSGAIDGFQFAFNTGNITSGTIKIYGVQ